MSNGAKTTLTDNEKQQIVDAIEQRGGTEPCDRCGNPNFTVEDGLVTLPLQGSIGGMTIGGPSIPAAVLSCSNCAKLNFHGVVGLDIVEEVPNDE